MSKMELIAPCHFGLEAVLKREIEDLGYEIALVEDGRITFYGDEEAVALANIFLRSAERILLKVGSFRAETFEELFQGTKNLPWEDFIPSNGKFWVAKAASVKSRLFSPSDIQSIMKKAMVERMKSHYGKEWFEEDAESYPIRVFLMKDIVTAGIDTSGDSLHKRGYRLRSSKAPISETMASALIYLTPWKKDRILVDPFCGCGTFPIEAALMAADVPPGMYREFTAMDWNGLVSDKVWRNAFDEAREHAAEGYKNIGVKADYGRNNVLSAQSTSDILDIQGYDIDPEMVRLARENAADAGVEKLIHFQAREVKDLRHSGKYGFIITNPPYGERIEDKETLPGIYSDFGRSLKMLESWSAYVITSYEDAEKYIGRKADKNRKLYNGMIKTYFYSFLGPRPPKNK